MTIFTKRSVGLILAFATFAFGTFIFYGAEALSKTLSISSSDRATTHTSFKPKLVNFRINKSSENLTTIEFSECVLACQGKILSIQLMEDLAKVPLFKQQTVIIEDDKVFINNHDDVNGRMNEKITWIIKRIETLAKIKLEEEA